MGECVCLILVSSTTHNASSADCKRGLTFSFSPWLNHVGASCSQYTEEPQVGSTCHPCSLATSGGHPQVCLGDQASSRVTETVSPEGRSDVLLGVVLW